MCPTAPTNDYGCSASCKASPCRAEDSQGSLQSSRFPVSGWYLNTEITLSSLGSAPSKVLPETEPSPLFSCCRNPWRVLLEPEYQNIENQPQTLITAEDGCRRAGLVGSGLNLPEQVPGKGGRGEGAANKGRLIVTVRVTY